MTVRFAAKVAKTMRLTLRTSMLLMVAFAGVGMGYGSAEENPVPNPGFETADNYAKTRPANWASGANGLVGKATWVNDVVHSGNSAVKIESTNYKPGSGEGFVRWSSDLFPAPPERSHVEVSAWVKAQNVVSGGGWYQLRYTVTLYDANKKKIVHYDAMSTEGSFDWTLVRRDIMLPQGAKYMALSLSMTACTGTAWMDDAAVTVLNPPRTTRSVLQSIEVAEAPVIVPTPWKVQYGTKSASFNRITAVVPEEAENVRAGLQNIVRGTGIELNMVAPNDPVPEAETVLIFSNQSNAAIEQQLSKAFPGTDLASVGTQGYYLSVQPGETQSTIYVASNTEQGQFYALQTLRQIIVNQGEKRVVPAIEVLDKSLVEHRGLAMGSQWYNRSFEAITRMAALKLNYVYNTGTFLGGKFGADGWRLPFIPSELADLRMYLFNAKRNFVDVTLSFSPRGKTPTKYSSDSEINLIVDKMSQLYDIGFRDFAVSFDDLQNIGQEKLIYDEDKEAFNNDMGKAHLYFVNQIYARLKEKHPDATLKCLPLWYQGLAQLSDAGQQYIVTLSQLPQEIDFITVPVDQADADAVMRLTHRKVFAWDNFYTADFLDVESAGLLPFTSPLTGAVRKTSDAELAGYMFLPAIPSRQDASGVSWYTSADYMWAPDRYDADKSHAQAIVKAVGSIENLRKLQSLNSLLWELEQATPPEDSAAKMAWAKSALEQLTAMRNDLPKYLPMALAQAMMVDANNQYQALQRIVAGN